MTICVEHQKPAFDFYFFTSFYFFSLKKFVLMNASSTALNTDSYSHYEKTCILKMQKTKAQVSWASAQAYLCLNFSLLK